VTSKDDIIQELRAARADLLAAIDGLTPAQMRIPGAVGIWSVKDVLAHLVAWESELVTALNQVENGQRPTIIDIDDIDEWNDERYHENVRRPLEAILDDLTGVHKMLLKMVGDLNAKQLTDNRVYDWMEGEPLHYLIEETATWHEREHVDEIRAWRDAQAL
jgi:hypothetical protein